MLLIKNGTLADPASGRLEMADLFVKGSVYRGGGAEPTPPTRPSFRAASPTRIPSPTRSA